MRTTVRTSHVFRIVRAMRYRNLSTDVSVAGGAVKHLDRGSAQQEFGIDSHPQIHLASPALSFALRVVVLRELCFLSGIQVFNNNDPMLGKGAALKRRRRSRARRDQPDAAGHLQALARADDAAVRAARARRAAPRRVGGRWSRCGLIAPLPAVRPAACSVIRSVARSVVHLERITRLFGKGRETASFSAPEKSDKGVL